MRGDVGRDRGDRLGPGAPRAAGRDAFVLALFRAAAVLGLRPATFLAAVLRHSRLARSTTGPLPRLLGHQRPAAGLRPATERVCDRGRWAGVAGQRSGPQSPHHRGRAWAASRYGAWLDLQGQRESRVAAHHRHQRGVQVRREPAFHLPTESGSTFAEAISALGAAAASVPQVRSDRRTLGVARGHRPRTPPGTALQRLTPAARGTAMPASLRQHDDERHRDETLGPQPRCRFTVVCRHRTRRGHPQPAWRPTAAGGRRVRRG